MVDLLHQQLHPEVDTWLLISGKALAAMGDIGRSELVQGTIVAMSPTGWRHGKYEARFGYTPCDFADEHNLGEVGDDLQPGFSLSVASLFSE